MEPANSVNRLAGEILEGYQQVSSRLAGCIGPGDTLALFDTAEQTQRVIHIRDGVVSDA